MNIYPRFEYQPDDDEAEKASNSYLMSLIVVMVGMPLPIINLLASIVFYVANRKSTYFVRWHCTQALLSQLSLFFINSAGFWWTVSIIFTDEVISNPYLAYLAFLFVFNLAEFIGTIFAAVQTRKCKHVSFWFFGSLTNLLCRR
jgi:uncharacterized membrane protein